MKFWTILALFVIVLAVFLRVGHAKETDESDDFVEKALENGGGEIENAEP